MNLLPLREEIFVRTSVLGGRVGLFGIVMLATVIVVWIRFKMVMMVMGKMWKDKLEADFNDDDCNDEANVGFEVDFGDEIE